MAGSVVNTEITHTSMKKLIFAWTSDSGAADGVSVEGFDGRIVGMTTIPGTGGVEPDNLYDVEVTDAQGHDVLLGQGADRSNVNTENVVEANMAGAADSVLTLAVTNAGDAKEGVVILWIR